MKKTLSYRMRRFLCIVAAASLLAAGCSGKSSAPAETAAPEAEAAETADAAAVTETIAAETALSDATETEALAIDGGAEESTAATEAEDSAGSGSMLPPDIGDDGSVRVWSEDDSTSAVVPMPEGFYLDEESSSRTSAVLRSSDTDSLNAELFYSLFAAGDMTDDAMLALLREEASSLQAKDDTSVDGPGDVNVISTPAGDACSAALYAAYEPSDGAPRYTAEYMMWRTAGSGYLVGCRINLYSANPQPVLSESEAVEMFLLPAE